MHLFLFALYYEDPRDENIGNNFVIQFPKSVDILNLQIWKIYICLSRNSRLKMRMILRNYRQP